MLYFPQLSTGAVGQYPIQKRRLLRTVVNEAADGTRVKLADTSVVAVEWTLDFQTLTDSERDALTQLNAGVEGRLGDFTFLDPTDNLLCWSEALNQAVWERNPLLTIAPGVADPNGGTSANRITNTGAAALAITQTVNGPGWFQYALSMQVRSDQTQQITLLRSTATQTQSAPFSVGPDWKQILLSGKFTGSEGSVIFGIQIGAGLSADLFGIQAEAQPGASGYKKTFSRCGVYPQARFLDDALSMTADGPNQHSCRIRIHTRA
jgi:hypothetical protein